jgi:hypothetical protein
VIYRDALQRMDHTVTFQALIPGLFVSSPQQILTILRNHERVWMPARQKEGCIRW